MHARRAWRALRQTRELVKQCAHDHVGLRGKQDVDRRQRLIIHAPAAMQRVIERRMDDRGRSVAARRLQCAAQVDPIEAHDDVGFLDRRGGVAGQEHARRRNVQRMIGGKRCADFEIGQHAGADEFGQAHARIPRFFASRCAADQKQRPLRSAQRIGRPFHERRRSARRRLGNESKRIDRRQRCGKRRFLKLRVEIHVDRGHRRRAREPRGAKKRFTHRRRRCRLIVPFDVRPHERALIARGVNPIDPRTPLRRVDRACRAEDQHGHPVAPRVEDRHRRVHQADVGVHGDSERASGDFRVAVRDRDGVFLVQTQQHLRRGVAEEIDEAVVQAAIARAGIQCNVRNVERAKRRRDDVAAERRLGGFDADRAFESASAINAIVHDLKR